jgi:hypothetical protein
MLCKHVTHQHFLSPNREFRQRSKEGHTRAAFHCTHALAYSEPLVRPTVARPGSCLAHVEAHRQGDASTWDLRSIVYARVCVL